ncbi:reticulocyte-binding protein homolog 2a-like [Macrobrachium rosenbergii]|uniref:reticulocyte-binding protein homolog 2a-like n=1 Tax=Macrobrachium rosenbergii TaxID=79674 RepID=UPI0034D4B4D2
MSVNELMDKAIKLGMSATEAEEFIAKQQAREDRLMERQEKRLQMELAEKEKEREEKEKEMERQEKRLQMELAEKEKILKLELAEKDKERVFKLECLKREQEEKEEIRKHELAKAALRSSGASSGISGDIKTLPKIPPFDEKIDEIDVYMDRFEKLAVFHQWDSADYGILLGTLLRGRALKVYCGLDPAIASNYDELKLALLKAFQVNPQVYRKKFREGYIESNESFVQYSHRLRQNFDKWLQLVNVIKSYEDVCDFMVMDQLLANCSKDLRTFLLERVCKNSHEMALAADRYLIAHGVSKCRNAKFRSSDKGSKLGNQNKSDKVTDSFKTVRCHLCKETGHIKPNCPNNPVNFAQSKSSDKKVPKISIALACR